MQQAHQLSESIEVKKRNSDGEYEYVTTVMNPEKFVDSGLAVKGDGT